MKELSALGNLVPGFTFLHFEEATLPRRLAVRLFRGVESVPGFTLLHFAQKSKSPCLLARPGRSTAGRFTASRFSRSEIHGAWH